MAGADFSAADKRERMSRQKHRCAECRKKLWHPILKCGLNVKGSVKPHFDHKKPRSRGGSSTLANCQALCPICHDEKSAKEFQEQMIAEIRAAFHTAMKEAAASKAAAAAEEGGAPAESKDQPPAESKDQTPAEICA